MLLIKQSSAPPPSPHLVFKHYGKQCSCKIRIYQAFLHRHFCNLCNIRTLRPEYNFDFYIFNCKHTHSIQLNVCMYIYKYTYYIEKFELFGSIHFCLLTVLNFVLFNLTFSSLCSSGFLRVLLQLFLMVCSVLVYVHVYSSI